jgi:uncharacterized membrane protein YraQ (UPF0718 family)
MILLNNFMALFMESAPWLLLGLLVAGLMKAFVPEDFLSKHLGKPGFLSTVKAALLGAPLPLCSCGVIPAAIGLRRSGASKASTTAFLISTPETGVDSISISYALLGPFMAVIRPIAAITSAITAGVLVGHDEEPVTKNSEASLEDSCCANKPVNSNVSHSKVSFFRKIYLGLHFTFIDLVKDISLWLLLGLCFAALIKTYIPNEFLAQWGDGLFAFIVMAVIGVPMYICATASTPIAAGLLFSGVSPGAVLVFMLVGPATNIATVGLVKNELGGRALAAYLGSVVGVGFAFGYLTNYLAEAWQLDFSTQTQLPHNMIDPSLASAASMLLALLMVNAIRLKFFKSEHIH